MLNLLLTLLTLAVIGGVAALFTGFLTGGGLGEQETSIPARSLPAGPIGRADLDGLRFVRALRGYRMDQVDAAIDRLGAEIESLRAELALRDSDRGAVDEPVATVSPPPSGPNA